MLFHPFQPAKLARPTSRSASLQSSRATPFPKDACNPCACATSNRARFWKCVYFHLFWQKVYQVCHEKRRKQKDTLKNKSNKSIICSISRNSLQYVPQNDSREFLQGFKSCKVPNIIGHKCKYKETPVQALPVWLQPYILKSQKNCSWAGKSEMHTPANQPPETGMLTNALLCAT